MSLAQPFICLIDGTDYGPAGLAAVRGASGDCTGVDRIGTAHIEVRFPASAGYVFVPTREVQIYVETYTGPTHTGNNPLFGGFVKAEGIKVYNTPSGETVVDLACQDYNCLLDAIIPDLDLGVNGHFTLGADTFEHQVADLVLQFQRNKRGAVAKTIDATHDVGAICGAHVFPQLNVATGLSLRQGLRILMQRAVAFNSALRPRFFLELVDDVTTPANVVCGLVVYDSAAGLPASSLTFAEVPGVGEHSILGISNEPHVRTLDASMPLANYIQTIWNQGGGGGGKVKTSEGTTSEATYWNAYINGGLIGNKGPWKLPVIQDTASTNDAEAQTVADLARFSKEFPRETFSIEEDGVYVQPGTTVHLRTTNVDQDYEVTAAQFSFSSIANPALVRYSLTLGLPLLELFDNSGADWTSAPNIFDTVAPNPPGLMTITSNTFNPDTGETDVTVSYAASPSPDTVGYYLVWRFNGQPTLFDVGNNLTPTISLPAGRTGTLDNYAYDRGIPPNVSGTGGTVACTTSLGTANLLNPGFDAGDPNDSTLPYRWTRTVANGGLARRGNPIFGASSGEIDTNGSLGSSAQFESTYLTQKPSGRIQLAFWLLASGPATTVSWTFTWYDSGGLVVGNTTGNVVFNGADPIRFTAAVVVPVTSARYYKLKFVNAMATARNAFVDGVTVTAQAGTDAIEPAAVTTAIIADGAVIVDKLDLAAVTTDQLPFFDAVGGNQKAAMWWATVDDTFNISAAGSSTDTGLRLRGGTTNGATIEIGGTLTGGAINISTPGASDPVRFQGMSVVLASTALATNATDGFVYIGSCAGKPTGTPTGWSGTIPVVLDSTNFLLYAYSGGAWRLLGLAYGASFPASPVTNQPFFRTDQNAVCVFDGTRWKGPKLSLSPIVASNSGGVQLSYSATTLISRFVPPTPEAYWLDSSSWWCRVDTTNNITNYWTLRTGHEGNTFGGSADLNLDTKGLTAGVAGFVTGNTFAGNPMDFSTTSYFDFFLEVRKDNGLPGTLNIWGVAITLRRIYT